MGAPLIHGCRPHGGLPAVVERRCEIIERRKLWGLVGKAVRLLLYFIPTPFANGAVHQVGSFSKKTGRVVNGSMLTGRGRAGWARKRSSESVESGCAFSHGRTGGPPCGRCCRAENCSGQDVRNREVPRVLGNLLCSVCSGIPSKPEQYRAPNFGELLVGSYSSFPRAATRLRRWATRSAGDEVAIQSQLPTSGSKHSPLKSTSGGLFLKALLASCRNFGSLPSPFRQQGDEALHLLTSD